MIKLQHMGKYGRRNVAECSSGIGNWMSIMSFISYFAIPINLLVLLICRYPNVQVGATQNMDMLDVEEKSYLVRYLEHRDPVFWSLRNIFGLCILVEHLIIGIKIIIALIIPDVPSKVTEDEFRRQKIEDTVLKELRDIKISS